MADQPKSPESSTPSVESAKEAVDIVKKTEAVESATAAEISRVEERVSGIDDLARNEIAQLKVEEAAARGQMEALVTELQTLESGQASEVPLKDKDWAGEYEVAATAKQIVGEVRAAVREQHERAINSAIDNLRASGYFRGAESAQTVFAGPDSPNAWVARCDARALMDEPQDPEWSKKFPPGDEIYKRLQAAGYRVDVWPDYENSDGETFAMQYFIYKDSK